MDANAASLRAIDCAVQHPCVAVVLLLLQQLDATIRPKSLTVARRVAR